MRFPDSTLRPRVARGVGLLFGVLLLLVPGASADVRLRGFDPVKNLFAAGGPDRVVAGPLVVAASPERIFGWSVKGGGARGLGRLPKLGPATNDILDGGGFVRVEAAQPGRVVVVRGEGRALAPSPEVGAGHHVVVGPPEGPFRDPAGCGERSGGPAGLSEDLVAYVAAATSEPPCQGRPVVTGPSVVVRDLAAEAAVVRLVPLPFDGAVAALSFDGPFLGLEVRSAPEDPDEEPQPPPPRTLVVVDVRTGVTVTRVPVRGAVPWDIGPDGSLVRGRFRRRGATTTCPVLADRLRLHVLGDAAGRELAGVPCGFPAPELRGEGVLRLALPRRDGRVRILDRRVADGVDQELAVVAGPLVGGDAEHLVVGDASCRVLDARVITLGGGPAQPAGPRTCPVHVRAPRTARSGTRLTVVVTCPRGCRGSAELRVFRPGDESTFGFDRGFNLAPGRFRKLHFELPRRAALGRPSQGTLVVGVASPVASRSVRRRFMVQPAAG